MGFGQEDSGATKAAKGVTGVLGNTVKDLFVLAHLELTDLNRLAA
jgi:hypothetical protein